MTRPGVVASAAHLTKKVEDKVVHVVFRRRTGMDLPPSDHEAGTVTFADAAREAHLGHDLPLGMAPGLDETYFFDPVDMPFAYGTHIAMVEVDAETGHVALLRHVVVDDCGRIINPLLVEGQVHGGAAQGVGQALMEAVVHGGGGEPMVSGFGDYAMPHATDLPAFETGHTETPTTLNPLGAKGVGEGATIGSDAGRRQRHPGRAGAARRDRYPHADDPDAGLAGDRTGTGREGRSGRYGGHGRILTGPFGRWWGDGTQPEHEERERCLKSR